MNIWSGTLTDLREGLSTLSRTKRGGKVWMNEKDDSIGGEEVNKQFKKKH